MPPRRFNDHLALDDVPRKKTCPSSAMSSFDLKHGEYLTDISGKKWKLGKTVGVGGFGQIYLASDSLCGDVKTESLYVAKVESHSNGPLFVEVNCYLRIAKAAQIDQWKNENKLTRLGMPHYVASGSHTHQGDRYRFLILPRFETDLEKILHDKKKLNLKTVLTISCQILDVLEYIHSKGYIHSDVKASNILLGNQTKSQRILRSSPTKVKKYTACAPVRTCKVKKVVPQCARNLRPVKHPVNYVDDILDFEKIISRKWSESLPKVNEMKVRESGNSHQVYLLDYGLACKYLNSSGEHKPFCVDERKAHAGTLLFCSRDAHKGVPSRRSDLESLGYNMIYWLTETLPWLKDLDDPELVAKKKQKSIGNLEHFLRDCFGPFFPRFLLDYFQYLQKLQFQEQPDYDHCKRLFKQTLSEFGYKDDSRFDFDNSEGWGSKQKKLKRIGENAHIKRLIYKVSRPPLQSNNIPIRPLLRKKIKNKPIKNLVRWSQIFIDNPEIIIKQARERKNTENNEFNSISYVTEMDIHELNPTYAMLEVYNRCRERTDLSPSYKGDSSLDNVDGYTPAMMSVLKRMRERKALEYELAVDAIRNVKAAKRSTPRRKKKTESPYTSSPLARTARSSTGKDHSGTPKRAEGKLKQSVAAVKKDQAHLRKMKSVSPRRNYSLRG